MNLYFSIILAFILIETCGTDNPKLSHKNSNDDIDIVSSAPHGSIKDENGLKNPPNGTIGNNSKGAGNKTADSHSQGNSPPPDNKIQVNSNPPLKIIDSDHPGALRRAVVVFGFLGLATVIYLFIYRRRRGSVSSTVADHPDSGPFRYGVLKNDTNLGKSEATPFIVDSTDDEDDLQIFDLQQRKSLSYGNLKKEDEMWASMKSDTEVIKSDKKVNDKNALVYLDDEDEYVTANFANSSSAKMV